MKRLTLVLLATLAGCICGDPVRPPDRDRQEITEAVPDSSNIGSDPIPPCTVYDLHCKNITQPGTGLQLVKCVRTSDPGCPVYSYMVVQPNEWQETCLHVNLDGSGETWYGPCDQ